MALPGGRPIVVDGKHYHWICKKERRASGYDEDDYGDEVPIYYKVVSIVADAGGSVVQHRVDVTAVTPDWVAKMIRADVVRGSFHTRKKQSA